MDNSDIADWYEDKKQKRDFVLFRPPTESLLSETIDYLHPKPGAFIGYQLPLDRLANKILIRPHELSIWTGISGHGKSNFLGQVILHSIMQGAKIAVASLELKNYVLYARLIRQASGVEKPTIAYIKKIDEWLKGNLFIAETVGAVTLDGILNCIEAYIKIYQVDTLIIDSLMMLNIAEDDYRKQKESIGTLCDFKNTHKCHVHLVAHQRKPLDESKAGGKLDVKGSGVITDLADNVFTIWRNKQKEIETYKALSRNMPLEQKIKNSPDGLFICDKQRNGEYEDQVPMWYKKKALQYVSYESQKERRYVEFNKETENENPEFAYFENPGF